MKHFNLCIAVLLILAGYATPSLATEDGEGSLIKETTSQFKQEDQQALADFAKTDFLNALQPLSMSAKAADPIDIKAALKMPNLGRGDPSKKYDIILQPGHYLRTPPGKLGTSGKLVSEQELVAFITVNVAKYLIENDKEKKLNVLVISADDYDHSGLNTDIFLAIHADGSAKPCSTGPSLGYKKESSLLGMHAIAFALATSMGQSYKDFQEDNFTVNEKDYYAFSAMKTPPKGYAGLLEIGELTCPDKEKALISNSLLIAKNVGVALKSSLDIIKEPLESKR